MSDDSTQTVRYCKSCQYALRDLHSRACPECGRSFDPDNPWTTSAYPGGPVSRAFAGFARVLTWAFIVVTLVAIVLSTLYHDPLVAFLAGIALAPLVLILLLLIAVPMLPISGRMRVLALVSMLMLASVLATGWPFQVLFTLHRSTLDQRAAMIRSGAVATPTGPVTIGGMRFKNISVKNGNIGFQITGGGGGGVHVVHLAPNATYVWDNTNWEIPLGGDWIWLYQD